MYSLSGCQSIYSCFELTTQGIHGSTVPMILTLPLLSLTTLHNQQNASRSTSARPVSRSVTPAGSSTASSTASSPTARCPPTRPSVAATTPSTPSSPRLALASTSPVPSSSISSPPSRRGPHRHLPPALPPRADHLRQGGRRQQLRPWPLHHRQGDCRPRPRPHPQARRQLHRSPGLPRLPRHRWWYRIRSRLAPPRAPVRRLRHEVQARLHRLPLSPGLHRRR